jgi:hypothetical protein
VETFNQKNGLNLIQAIFLIRVAGYFLSNYRFLEKLAQPYGQKKDPIARVFYISLV